MTCNPAEALALLERLRIPADAEGLARLRKVLHKGAKNHYDNPALWNDAVHTSR